MKGIKLFSQVASERRTTWQSALPLEMAFIESSGATADDHSTGSSGDGGKTPQQSLGKESVEKPSPPVERETRQVESSAKKAASPPPELSGTINFEQILGSWRDVLQAARSQDPRVQALLNSCRPLGLEKGALVIGFSSDLLREKMEKTHNLRVAAEALEQVFGDSFQLRCVLTESWNAGDYEAQKPPPMEEEGMVATALRELGAQVVDVERLPKESSGGETAN
jgi:hypothetical protein